MTLKHFKGLLQEGLGPADSFLRFGDRDQLVPRRFGSTIPGLVEKGHRSAARQGRGGFFLDDLVGGKFRCAPHTLKRGVAGAFQLFARGRNFLELVTERVHRRVGVLPGVDKRLGIEWPDELLPARAASSPLE